jgi:aminopeptidase N
MSADNRPEPAPDGVYAFEMPQAIPSYLLALAVGELGFHALGPRSGVYAEPATLARAADELADTERMIEIAEGLYGPYRWGRYDLLVLPPAFPFGGMENPRLTFLTPTFIAGDRSLVALIAHELAHSWSGNLVTNAGWNHFWLNEGFTVYVEGRIVEALYGRAQLDMERVLARTQLKRELERLPPGDQRLLLNLARRDPDDGLTAVAYQKGAAFLEFLEERFGREHFDPFLRAWFDRHAFQSATTAQFLDFLERELMARHPGRVRPEEIDAFVNQPGLPALERYLLEVGRRRLILPLYELLAATPAGRERARAIYARARSGYHAIAQGSIDALLADARRK